MHREEEPLNHHETPGRQIKQSNQLSLLLLIPHIKYLKAKCLKALNLLKVLSHTSWGADRTTLLKLNTSLVQSKLDYGCIIYGSAKLDYGCIIYGSLKRGKDPAEHNNYRPIALTSCLCKTLEIMINKRLNWFLESNNHISRLQSGFRSDRSTTDNLVRSKTFIRDAFIKKEHVVAVFFYLEKAYDTTWRYGILKDVHKLGLRSRLPTFIENFLADRDMQVRVDSSLSDYYDQEQGVPQEGVLSTTLFSIKINDIVKCLGNLTNCSLYVDDFFICYRSKSMATIECQLQQNLNKIENWATSNGFKFSKSKTQCVHSC